MSLHNGVSRDCSGYIITFNKVVTKIWEEIVEVLGYAG